MAGAFDRDTPVDPDAAANAELNANKVAAQAFGITEALIKQFPELAQVWELFLAGNLTDAKLAYYNTNYYQNLSSTSKSRSTLKATQRGVYDQQLESYRLSQRKRLIAKGINLDDASFNSLTESAFDLTASRLKDPRFLMTGICVLDCLIDIDDEVDDELE